MTEAEAEAEAIVDEQISLWKNQGITEAEAWESLNREALWCIAWWEIRRAMIRWQLAYAADRTITKRAA